MWTGRSGGYWIHRPAVSSAHRPVTAEPEPEASIDQLEVPLDANRYTGASAVPASSSSPELTASFLPAANSTTVLDAIVRCAPEFTVTSFSEGDGLVPGSYRVRVECWKKVPTMGTPGESYIAADYQLTTVEVGAEAGTVDVPLDVPLAK